VQAQMHLDRMTNNPAQALQLFFKMQMMDA
jgi:hypothetical protein